MTYPAFRTLSNFLFAVLIFLDENLKKASLRLELGGNFFLFERDDVTFHFLV